MRFARHAAISASALLAGAAVIHLYWALGGSWALHTVSGDSSSPSAGARTFFAVVATLAIAAAVEALVLGRVVAGPVLRRTVWVTVGVLGVGGVIRLSAAPVVGLAAILFALLFAVLVFEAPRSARARPPRRR